MESQIKTLQKTQNRKPKPKQKPVVEYKMNAAGANLKVDSVSEEVLGNKSDGGSGGGGGLLLLLNGPVTTLKRPNTESSGHRNIQRMKPKPRVTN